MCATKRLPLQLPDWLDFSMVALVCSVIVGYLLCRVLVSKKHLFLENTSLSIYCVLKEIKEMRKWARDLRKREMRKEKKYQICVFFAQRRVCLQADIDNFLAPQNM